MRSPLMVVHGFWSVPAMVALKFREVYATLEEAIDAAEDAREVIERIVAKAQ